MTIIQIKDIYERYLTDGSGLTGDETAELIHDWEARPESTEDNPLTYVEEWDVDGLDGKHIGCLYDDGNGYEFAPGYHAGSLDY